MENQTIKCGRLTLKETACKGNKVIGFESCRIHMNLEEKDIYNKTRANGSKAGANKGPSKKELKENIKKLEYQIDILIRTIASCSLTDTATILDISNSK
ncbi:hypothetical protein GGF37_000982 [Kickxella alabastrina]|nr:hypothetical protein GGF37_000982 [Kickxella alabastrina]